MTIPFKPVLDLGIDDLDLTETATTASLFPSLVYEIPEAPKRKRPPQKLIDSVEPLIRQEAAKYGIPYNLAMAQLYTESSFKSETKSPAGAGGIGQFMPKTWLAEGGEKITKKHDPRSDPKKAIPLYAKHMKNLYNRYKRKNPEASEQELWAYALAGYNAGEWVVGQVEAGKRGYMPETINYIENMFKRTGEKLHAGYAGTTTTAATAEDLVTPFIPSLDLGTEEATDLVSFAPSLDLGDEEPAEGGFAPSLDLGGEESDLRTGETQLNIGPEAYQRAQAEHRTILDSQTSNSKINRTNRQAIIEGLQYGHNLQRLAHSLIETKESFQVSDFGKDAALLYDALQDEEQLYKDIATIRHGVIDIKDGISHAKLALATAKIALSDDRWQGKEREAVQNLYDELFQVIKTKKEEYKFGKRERERQLQRFETKTSRAAASQLGFREHFGEAYRRKGEPGVNLKEIPIHTLIGLVEAMDIFGKGARFAAGRRGEELEPHNWAQYVRDNSIGFKVSRPETWSTGGLAAWGLLSAAEWSGGGVGVLGGTATAVASTLGNLLAEATGGENILLSGTYQWDREKGESVYVPSVLDKAFTGPSGAVDPGILAQGRKQGIRGFGAGTGTKDYWENFAITVAEATRDGADMGIIMLSDPLTYIGMTGTVRQAILRGLRSGLKKAKVPIYSEVVPEAGIALKQEATLVEDTLYRADLAADPSSPSAQRVPVQELAPKAPTKRVQIGERKVAPESQERMIELVDYISKKQAMQESIPIEAGRTAAQDPINLDRLAKQMAKHGVTPKQGESIHDMALRATNALPQRRAAVAKRLEKIKEFALEGDLRATGEAVRLSREIKRIDRQALHFQDRFSRAEARRMALQEHNNLLQASEYYSNLTGKVKGQISRTYGPITELQHKTLSSNPYHAEAALAQHDGTFAQKLLLELADNNPGLVDKVDLQQFVPGGTAYRNGYPAAFRFLTEYGVDPKLVHKAFGTDGNFFGSRQLAIAPMTTFLEKVTVAGKVYDLTIPFSIPGVDPYAFRKLAQTLGPRFASTTTRLIRENTVSDAKNPWAKKIKSEPAWFNPKLELGETKVGRFRVPLTSNGDALRIARGESSQRLAAYEEKLIELISLPGSPSTRADGLVMLKDHIEPAAIYAKADGVVVSQSKGGPDEGARRLLPSYLSELPPGSHPLVPGVDRGGFISIDEVYRSEREFSDTLKEHAKKNLLAKDKLTHEMGILQKRIDDGNTEIKSIYQEIEKKRNTLEASKKEIRLASAAESEISIIEKAIAEKQKTLWLMDDFHLAKRNLGDLHVMQGKEAYVKKWKPLVIKEMDALEKKLNAVGVKRKGSAKFNKHPLELEIEELEVQKTRLREGKEEQLFNKLKPAEDEIAELTFQYKNTAQHIDGFKSTMKELKKGHDPIQWEWRGMAGDTAWNPVRQIELFEETMIATTRGIEKIDRGQLDQVASIVVNRKLQNIKGIGSKTRDKILTYFGSEERVIQASLEDIQSIQGITNKKAETIYNGIREAVTKEVIVSKGANIQMQDIHAAFSGSVITRVVDYPGLANGGVVKGPDDLRQHVNFIRLREGKKLDARVRTQQQKTEAAYKKREAERKREGLRPQDPKDFRPAPAKTEKTRGEITLQHYRPGGTGVEINTTVNIDDFETLFFREVQPEDLGFRTTDMERRITTGIDIDPVTGKRGKKIGAEASIQIDNKGNRYAVRALRDGDDGWREDIKHIPLSDDQAEWVGKYKDLMNEFHDDLVRAGVLEADQIGFNPLSGAYFPRNNTSGFHFFEDAIFDPVSVGGKARLERGRGEKFGESFGDIHQEIEPTGVYGTIKKEVQEAKKLWKARGTDFSEGFLTELLTGVYKRTDSRWRQAANDPLKVLPSYARAASRRIAARNLELGIMDLFGTTRVSQQKIVKRSQNGTLIEDADWEKGYQLSKEDNDVWRAITKEATKTKGSPKIKILKNADGDEVAVSADAYNWLRTFDNEGNSFLKKHQDALSTTAFGRGIMEAMKLGALMSNAFKRTVLVARPQYHIVNIMNDSIQLTSMGMNNPAKWLKEARKLQKNVKQYRLKRVDGLTLEGEHLLMKARQQGLAHNSAARIDTFGGDAISLADRIELASINHSGKGINWKKWNVRAKTWGVKQGEVFAAHWTDTAQLAGFLYRMRHGDSVSQAAKRTFDALMDYNDRDIFLNILRVFAPFATWAAKAPAMTARAFASRPGAAMLPIRWFESGQRGAERRDPTGTPYPQAQWQTEAGGYFRTGDPTKQAYGGLRQAFGGSPLGEGEDFLLRTRIPYLDALAPPLASLEGLFRPGLKGFMAPWALQASPFWKMTYETATGENLLTKQPLAAPSLMRPFAFGSRFLPGKETEGRRFLEAGAGQSAWFSRYFFNHLSALPYVKPLFSPMMATEINAANRTGRLLGVPIADPDPGSPVSVIGGYRKESPSRAAKDVTAQQRLAQWLGISGTTMTSGKALAQEKIEQEHESEEAERAYKALWSAIYQMVLKNKQAKE